MSENSSPSSPPRQHFCRYCGALLWEPEKPYCWLCHQPADGSEPKPAPATVPPSTVPPLLSPPLPPKPPEHFTYSLSTLMLAMTLVAVLSGLCVIAPGLGIPLAILSVPAWIRTARVVTFDARESRWASVSRKIQIFNESFGFALLVCLAAGAAGFAACTGVVFIGLNQGGSEFNFNLAIVAFVAAALIVFVFTCVRFWRRYKKPRDK